MSGTLTYDVTIVSTSITAASPTASWTFNIRSCANEYDPWVDVADPTESISFDVSDPLASLELNSYHYEGNPIAICGNLEISIQDDAGSDIEFLSAELVGEDIIVSIDLNSAVLGTYNVVLKFSEPGEQTYSLFELEVIDSLPCKSVATTNTVAKMNDQNFELTGTITFTPDATVSD